tara:strand:+ start:1057 stop:2199 length:1143 start_codon:yes stop_codon:yes gene_type:complete
MSEIKVNSIKGVGASAAAITVNNTDGTCTANITNNLSNRNKIINGSMICSQRGGSFTGITSSQYTLDRYRFAINQSGTFTVSQSTDTPDGFGNSIKIDCTTANASLGASAVCILQQRIEGFNLQDFAKGTTSAKQFTLSFYAKSTKTGTYIAELIEGDASRSVSASYTISDTNWNRYTITFPADTTGTLANNNTRQLDLNMFLSAGSDLAGGGSLQTTWGAYSASVRGVGQVNLADNTSNEFYLTGLQLEVGSVATDFEHLSFADELRRCERYCETIAIGEGDGAYISNAVAYFTNQMYSIIRFRTPKRATNPTLVQTTGTNYYVLYRRGGSVNADSFTGTSWPSIHGSAIYNSMTCTDGDSGLLGSANSGAKLLFTSEL